MDRRKLTLQLTPLLDLLLIVFFAQYMEVRIAAEQESERGQANQMEARAELDDLQAQLAALQKHLKALEQENRRRETSDSASREQLGRLFGELFKIPDSMIKKIADRRSPDENLLPESEIAALLAEFKALAAARGDQIVDHLLTFTEMKKRFDVWDFYVHKDDYLIVSAGSRHRRLDREEITDPEVVADEFFKVYKSLPQTKDVVLMLVSYGDAQLQYRQAVIKALPVIAERMRQDTNGKVKFEYAVLGFRPDAVPRP